MMWLTWRQHRAGLLAGAGLLTALAVFVVITGNDMRATYASLGLDRCPAPAFATCSAQAIQFQQATAGLLFLAPALLLGAPALIGVFWGAPLVAREIEQGTHRLVWTQAVTRQRWMLTKVAVLAVAGAAALGAASALLAWWIDPALQVRPQRVGAPMFDILGVVPAAYSAAALALGVAAGALVRRTVPAIGLTLLLFVALRLGVELGLRPHYQQPVTTDTPWPAAVGQPGPAGDNEGWIISRRTLTADGEIVSDYGGFDYEPLMRLCPEVPTPSQGAGGPDRVAQAQATAGEMSACATRLGLHVVTVHQPEDRFWRFQLTEAAIYLAITVALLGGTAWRIRRIP